MHVFIFHSSNGSSRYNVLLLLILLFLIKKTDFFNKRNFIFFLYIISYCCTWDEFYLDVVFKYNKKKVHYIHSYTLCASSKHQQHSSTHAFVVASDIHIIHFSLCLFYACVCNIRVHAKKKNYYCRQEKEHRYWKKSFSKGTWRRTTENAFFLHSLCFPRH